MTRWRAITSLLILAGLILGPGLPAQAATKNVPVQGTNWFWKNQQRPAVSDFGVNCPEGVPACVDQRSPGANTHETGALPVAVTQGEDEKIASILFDLTFLPFQGAVISKFTFSVIQSQDPRDQAQTVSVGDHKIQACLINEVWTPSEEGADEMKEAPKFDAANCVDGVPPKEGQTPPRWVFDTTTLVAPWGEAPSSAYGVMLVGNKPADSQESWQIVLKGPRRDTAETPANEAKDNAGNIKATIQYTPKAAPSFASFEGFPSTPGFGFGTSDFGTTPGGAFPAGTATPPAPGTAPTAAQGPGQGQQAPTMPWYFWLLIPTGLMGLSLVRHTILEPLPGKRADGVVALIRRHNAARLGRSLTAETSGPLLALSGALRSTGLRIRSLARRVVSGGKKR